LLGVAVAMINALFVQSGYETAKKIETPNYKRIDLSQSFQTQLEQALTSGDTTQILSLSPSLSVDTTAVSQNHDGNSVTLEDELMALSQNTLAHHLGHHRTRLTRNTL
jgi:flagellar basal body rod protein FlgB